MSAANEGEFIANIIRILHKNGYPDKRVSLPLEKMYEIAHEKNINFNKILEFLKEEKGVHHEKTTEKIIFFEGLDEPIEEKQDTTTTQDDMFGKFMNMGPEFMQNLNMPDLMSKAADMIKSMSPNQLAEFQKMYANLSEEQREEMLKKARDMGFLKK